MTGDVQTPAPVPEPLQVALHGLCPRCGAKTLFAGLTNFTDRCPACDLDISAFNVGDGPAAFLTLIIGAIVMIGAVTLTLTLAPPIWVHLLIWTPLTAIGVIGALRLSKAALISLEYRNKATEGRIKAEDA
ncbi:DUF983 domain-containing protein [Sphingomonas sp. 28-63-12]|uniref:DUF983 domain-containing protein n=1 Tax=Sphingomonas sp. 28-63-12 TaxID=1970434 RepID=UPI0035A85570